MQLGGNTSGVKYSFTHCEIKDTDLVNSVTQQQHINSTNTPIDTHRSNFMYAEFQQFLYP